MSTAQLSQENVDETRDSLAVGDEIKLIKDIYDDGEDHHPPGWLARSGEILVVRHLYGNGNLSVSHHDITNNSFRIFAGEYVPHINSASAPKI